MIDASKTGFEQDNNDGIFSIRYSFCMTKVTIAKEIFSELICDI